MLPNQLAKDRIASYDLLRSVLIILVVLGHATFLDITTPFGGIRYGEMLLAAGYNISTFHRIARFLTSWIYTFHMPLFIALSGTIYGLQQRKDKPINTRTFVRKKSLRLMFPFIIVWVFWNAPIKYITGYYDSSGFSLFLQMLCPNSVYLWFLECLFVVSIIMLFIDKIKGVRIKTLVIFFLWIIGLFLYYKFTNYGFLGNPLYYLLWFYIGIHIEQVITSLENFMPVTKETMTLLFVTQIGLFIFRRLRVSNLINAGLTHFILPFLMTVVAYYFIKHHAIQNRNMIDKFSVYGMGIYLYADPLNYILLYLFYRFFGIGVFANEIGSAVLWLLRILLTSATAVMITWLLKKADLKYLY